MTCTFFGHRDATDVILPSLRETLTELIENRGIDTFYVGNNGRFDSLVQSELEKLCKIYAHISFFVVLAYRPGKRNVIEDEFYKHTLYPEGLDGVPPRFAIDKRNRIMIKWSDIVVTYVSHGFGGAAKFEEIAEKAGKGIVRLSRRAVPGPE